MIKFEPKNINFKVNITKESTIDKLYIHNIPRGFGYTICNSIRRTIISYTPGISICGFYLDTINHPFDDSVNFVETVDEICENIRNICIKYDNKFEECIINYDFEGPCTVTSDMIQSCTQDINITSKNKKIIEVSQGGKYQLRLIVKKGYGFKTKEDNREFIVEKHTEDKLICTTSVFSNIIRANYDVDIDQINPKAETIFIEYEYPSDIYEYGFVYKNALNIIKQNLGILEDSVIDYIDDNFFINGISEYIIEYLSIDAYKYMKEYNIYNKNELISFVNNESNIKNMNVTKSQIKNLLNKVIRTNEASQ